MVYSLWRVTAHTHCLCNHVCLRPPVCLAAALLVQLVRYSIQLSDPINSVAIRRVDCFADAVLIRRRCADATVICQARVPEAT